MVEMLEWMVSEVCGAPNIVLLEQVNYWVVKQMVSLQVYEEINHSVFLTAIVFSTC